MKKNIFRKYIGLTLGLTVLCTVALLTGTVYHVFGQFVPEKPYVKQVEEGDNKGDPSPEGLTSSFTTVTFEGGNTKGSEGSGAKPCSEKVPPAEKGALKGTKDNPFVILEIIPEHAQQQLIYLNADNPDCPLNFLKIGIDACSDSRNFTNDSDIVHYDKLSQWGYWFYNYGYEVYKTDGSGEKETKKLVKVDRLYKLTISEKDITNAGYTMEAFETAYNSGNGTMSDLKKNFPALFNKDTTKAEIPIRDEAIADNRNWTKGSDAEQITIIVQKEDIKEEDQNLSIKELAEKYPTLFEKDTKGNLVEKSEFENSSQWNMKEESHSYTVTSSDMVITDNISGMSVSEIAEKYPSLFKEDSNGNKIPSGILQKDWEVSSSKLNSWESLSPNGYFIYVGDGKGDYKNNTTNANQWYSEFLMQKKEADSENEGYNWIYSETEPSGDQYFSFREKYYDDSDPTKYFDIVKNTVDDSLVGGYLSCSDFSKVNVTGCTKYEFEYSSKTYKFSTTKNTFNFEYYGLKATDVLKRSLFNFTSEEECNNFNMKVIAMTPSEINAIAKKDDKDKLDMVERADMFYIGAYASNTNGISNVYKLYNTYVDTASTADSSSMKDYYDNDLDWDQVYKILDRLCNNANLPLMMTQGLGEMLDNNVESIHTYMSSNQSDVTKTSVLNNMAKLYIIAIQFDLLARKNSGEYERTFYEDILPKLNTIQLNSSAIPSDNADSATTTGYYERTPLSTNTSLSSADKKKCYYLWNMLTFYPSEIEPTNQDQIDTGKISEYIKYGYLKSFFNSNAASKVFSDVYSHHVGSDGTDDKNMGVVSKGNSDTNFSTILGSDAAESAGVVNGFTDVAYKIMNGQSVTPPKALSVSIVKQHKLYQKLTDDAVLIDYNQKAKYKQDKTLYVKVKVENVNNEDGIIEKVELLNEAEKAVDTDPIPQSTLEKSTSLSKENIKDINDQNSVNGYRVSANSSLTFYVPYQLSDWQRGYQTIRLTMRGRKYIIKGDKKITTLGSQTTWDISITERTLFNLE